MSSSAMFSKYDEYGFERPEHFDYAEYEKFMSVYLRILTKRSMRWLRLLGVNPRLKKNNRLRAYVRKGVPMSLRSQVWMAVGGAQKLKDDYGPGLYEELLNKPIDEEIRRIITVDVPRTFPDNIHFHPASENQSALLRILYAFAAHNPYVGYCQ